jgi:Tol biopolymer transport system component
LGRFEKRGPRKKMSMRVWLALLATLPLLAFGFGATAGNPSPVSQNGLIAVRGEEGLYLVDPQGSGRRVLPGTTSADEFRWSADGRLVAFTVGPDVKTLRADGKGLRLVMRNAWAPSWSPDGERLSVIRDTCDRSDCAWSEAIYTVGADGSGPRQLTSELDEPDGTLPVWSSDGKWIAYGTFDGIASRGPDGSGLSWPAGYDEDDPLREVTWSSDHRWLAFATDEAIYRLRPNGDSFHQLAHGESMENLVWSPDGSTIAFNHLVNEPLRSQVTLIDVETGRQRDLTRVPPVSFAPAWSPDGKQLAFLGCDRYVRSSSADGDCGGGLGGNLWVVDADGTNVRSLKEWSYGPPSWLPAVPGASVPKPSVQSDPSQVPQ